jgi:hypothetical protein
MSDKAMTDSERLVRIETMLEGITDRDRDFETRLRRLEKILYIGIGLAAALGSAGGSFVSAALSG